MELMDIPGIGEARAEKLISLGIEAPEDLLYIEPEAEYLNEQGFRSIDLENWQAWAREHLDDYAVDEPVIFDVAAYDNTIVQVAGTSWLVVNGQRRLIPDTRTQIHLRGEYDLSLHHLIGEEAGFFLEAVPEDRPVPEHPAEGI